MAGRRSMVWRLIRLSLPGNGRWASLRGRRIILVPIFTLLFLVFQLLHWVGFVLDDILFRGYRSVRVREPLFIVGLPRSGTSHLQSVLAGDPRFTTMRLWELLLAPSVTERKVWLGLAALDRAVGRPLGRVVDGIQRRGFGWMEEVHPLSLFEPEEDYLLLLPIFACFLLVVPFPEHSGIWALTRFDEWPEEDRETILDFYEACLQRHLYVVGEEKQLLSKNPAFTPFSLSLAQRFPAARFVLCVRDPRKAVPSLLSSLEAGARFFGHEVARPATRDRLVRMMQEFGEQLEAVADELPTDRWAFAPLREVRADLVGTVEEIYERFGWMAGPAFRDALIDRTSRARSHQSRHSYRAEDYGLSMEEIEREFRPLIDRFGFERSDRRVVTDAGRTPARPAESS